MTQFAVSQLSPVVFERLAVSHIHQSSESNRRNSVHSTGVFLERYF